MKKILFAALAATTLLASCSKENINGEKENDGIVAGKSTYASFSFKVDNSTTRAMSDDASEPAGTVVNDIRLLIFKTGTSTVCEVNEVVTGSTLTKSKTVLLTSGNKKIFVIANAEGQPAAKTILDGISVNNTTLAQFYAKTLDMGTGTGTDPVTALNLSPIIGSSALGMIMSNAADATCARTLAPGVSEADATNGITNSFEFVVYRAVAKGVVYYKTAAVLSTADGNGTLSSLKYVFRNINRSAYLFQQFANDGVTITATTKPYAPYFNAFDSKTAVELQAQSTYDPYYYSGETTKENLDLSATAPTSSFYFTENTNSTQRIGNSTYAAIEGVYTPVAAQMVSAFTYDALNDKFISLTTGTALTTGETFYMLNVSALPYATGLTAIFFSNEELAKKAAYCALTGEDVATYVSDTHDAQLTAAGAISIYTNGKCYYRLNIGEGNTADNTIVYGVKRNHNYKAEITKFAAIGYPAEGDLTKDPETPLGEVTYVSASISVQPWKDAPSQTEL